jgi:hypothetical protein
MTLAFWYWLLMALWLLFGGGIVYRRRAELAPFYWGFGFSLVLFLLLVIIGCKIFPDPFGTLIKG